MRRVVLLALLLAAPALLAQQVTLRVAVFEHAGAGKATPPDHVTSREWPSDLNQLWDLLGTRGIALKHVERFTLGVADHRNVGPAHVTLERVGGSKARVGVAVDGASGPFSLPIPYNSTFVISTPDDAENPQWIAVSVFDDAAAAKVPDVHHVGGDLKAPVKMYSVEPVYPEELRLARVQGIVILSALIDTNGKVTGAHVLKPLAGLEDAAMDAVKQWRFQPATLDGKPVTVLFNLTIQFRLR